MEGAIIEDGEAAYACAGMETYDKTPAFKVMQVAGAQPFYIPSKVQEQDEVTISETASLDGYEDVMPDFDFETDTGMWISSNPQGHESRSSLATTVVDDRSSRGLRVDTNLASSSISILSSSAESMSSAISTSSADMYGWEEELDRKTSIETHSQVGWEANAMRRLPGTGVDALRNARIPGSGAYAPGDLASYQYKRADGKRKSLLYRVMHISGHRRTPSDAPPLPTTTAQATMDDGLADVAPCTHDVISRA